MIRRAILPRFILAGTLLAPLLLSGASPLLAQRRAPGSDPPPQTFTLRGSVRMADNELGVESVRVDLKRFTGETVNSRFTRSNGEFEFPGLGRGIYQLVVQERGYAPAQEEVEIHNTSRSGVVIYLRRADPEFAKPGGHTVSVREFTLPRKAREAYARGLVQARDRRDPRGSVSHFQRAIQEVPDYYEAHYQLGLVQMDLGQFAEAEQSLQRSIETSNHRFADPYFALASLRSNHQRFAEGEALARQGLELDPTAWQGHFELARALFALGKVDEAANSLTAAKDRRDAYAPFHLLGANICIKKKDYVALLGELEAYLKIDPDGPMSADVRRMRDQVRQAMQKAAATPPPQP